MASTVARKYDLTKKMAPFFDIHMLLNILNFLREQKLYDVEEITKEKINAIKSTNMLSLIEEEYEKFLGDTDMKDMNEKSQLEQRKTEIFQKLENEPEGVLKVKRLFEDEQLLKELKDQQV